MTTSTIYRPVLAWHDSHEIAGRDMNWNRECWQERDREGIRIASSFSYMELPKCHPEKCLPQNREILSAFDLAYQCLTYYRPWSKEDHKFGHVHPPVCLFVCLCPVCQQSGGVHDQRSSRSGHGGFNYDICFWVMRSQKFLGNYLSIWQPTNLAHF